MKSKHIGLIFALMLGTPVVMLGTPAVASVNATHDPSQDRALPSTVVPYENGLEVVSHNEVRSLPLECRGYNVSEKLRRESATRSINRCE